MAEERTQADDLRDFAEEQRNEAERLRGETPPEQESEEDYYARVRSVPGVFGDVDTTGGVTASETDVPASNNEAATVAVAEADAKAEAGDEEAQDTSTDEARSQASFGRVNDEAEEGQAAPADVNPDEAEQVTEERQASDEE